MLKLTLKPGDYIDIGDDVRVVFSGGSANSIYLLVDAPREMNIARSTARGAKKKQGYYYCSRQRYCRYHSSYLHLSGRQWC